MQKVHISLLDGAASFPVIARRAGSHQVFPGMSASQVTGFNMVYRQANAVNPAVLAGVVITAENFALGQADFWAGTFDHFRKADDGWTRKSLRNRPDFAAPIQHQAGFFFHN